MVSFINIPSTKLILAPPPLSSSHFRTLNPTFQGFNPTDPPPSKHASILTLPILQLRKIEKKKI